MNKNLKTSAIICAAGKGERAGFGRNKLFTTVAGAPVIYHTLKAFDIPEISEVILACAEEDLKEMRAIAAPFNCRIVTGGSTRTETVKKALKAVTGDVVLIHDGARPFVTREIILNCIASVEGYGSGVCALPVTDTVAHVEYGVVVDVPPRDETFAVQTPQGFMTENIRHAYDMAGDKTYSDDSTVYAEFVAPPRICEGDRGNIKLTYAADFRREYPAVIQGGRIGFGVDVHAFGEGDGITLAGVKIPFNKTLIAHSDGDVVLHALTDALFSAAGLKDIGHYFPCDDDKYLGADSGKLLKIALEEVKKAGLEPANISVTIQAEKPKLAIYIDKMVEKLAELTCVDKSCVAVAAGTSEKLGFVGEGLGICAYCAVSVRRIQEKEIWLKL